MTIEILTDADHPVTKTLIYIHSMETFIYGDLKKTCLNRDYSKVKTLGPYAYVIRRIIIETHLLKIEYDDKSK